MSKKQNRENHLSIDEIEDFIRKNIHGNTLDRRKLISSCARVAGGIIIGEFLFPCGNQLLAEIAHAEERMKAPSPPNSSKAKTILVRISNKGSVDSSGEAMPGAVSDMLSNGIKELTGENDSSSAWKIIAEPGHRVGIKVNCRGGRHLSTQIPVVMAIVEGLKMAGVKERDIIIWDQTKHDLEGAGYQLNSNTDSLRCVDTNSVGYQDDEQNVNGTKFRLSRILTEEIDVLINVPIMKNHGMAGVTLSLKSHYGSHDNPQKHHNDYCDPHIANINAHEIIRSKTKLIVLDALRAQCNGGPQDKPKWKWNPGTILIGFDPVAIDRIGSDMIEARRLEIGVNSLGNSHRHIITAARLGVGTDDRTAINVRDINLN
jgi:uncharacterized protein (DUF362 family)